VQSGLIVFAMHSWASRAPTKVVAAPLGDRGPVRFRADMSARGSSMRHDPKKTEKVLGIDKYGNAIILGRNGLRAGNVKGESRRVVVDSSGRAVINNKNQYVFIDDEKKEKDSLAQRLRGTGEALREFSEEGDGGASLYTDLDFAADFSDTYEKGEAEYGIPAIDKTKERPRRGGDLKFTAPPDSAIGKDMKDFYEEMDLEYTAPEMMRDYVEKAISSPDLRATSSELRAASRASDALHGDPMRPRPPPRPRLRGGAAFDLNTPMCTTCGMKTADLEDKLQKWLREGGDLEAFYNYYSVPERARTYLNEWNEYCLKNRRALEGERGATARERMGIIDLFRKYVFEDKNYFEEYKNATREEIEWDRNLFANTTGGTRVYEYTLERGVRDWEQGNVDVMRTIQRFMTYMLTPDATGTTNMDRFFEDIDVNTNDVDAVNKAILVLTYGMYSAGYLRYFYLGSLKRFDELLVNDVNYTWDMRKGVPMRSPAAARLKFGDEIPDDVSESMTQETSEVTLWAEGKIDFVQYVKMLCVALFKTEAINYVFDYFNTTQEYANEYGVKIYDMKMPMTAKFVEFANRNRQMPEHIRKIYEMWKKGQTDVSEIALVLSRYVGTSGALDAVLSDFSERRGEKYYGSNLETLRKIAVSIIRVRILYQTYTQTIARDLRGMSVCCRTALRPRKALIK